LRRCRAFLLRNTTVTTLTHKRRPHTRPYCTSSSDNTRTTAAVLSVVGSTRSADASDCRQHAHRDNVHTHTAPLNSIVLALQQPLSFERQGRLINSISTPRTHCVAHSDKPAVAQQRDQRAPPYHCRASPTRRLRIAARPTENVSNTVSAKVTVLAAHIPVGAGALCSHWRARALTAWRRAARR
jgi:hypothetical protein